MLRQLPESLPQRRKDAKNNRHEKHLLSSNNGPVYFNSLAPCSPPEPDLPSSG